MKPEADLFIYGAGQLVTCVAEPGNPLGLVQGGAVAAVRGNILASGSQELKENCGIAASPKNPVHCDC